MAIRDLAAAVDLEVGCAVAAYATRGNLPGTLSPDGVRRFAIDDWWALSNEFNYLVLGGDAVWNHHADGIWWGLRPDEPAPPAPDVFDWVGMDVCVDHAQTNNQKVLFQHFVWGYALPPWLDQPGSGGGALNYTPEQIRGILYRHLQAVMTRYAGRVHDYDVINEMFGRTANCWADSPGMFPGDPNPMRYAEQAFAWCRDLDPAARLIDNDYLWDGNATGNFDTHSAWLADALSRGVPIDAAGFQCHIHNGNGYATPAEFERRWKILSDMGLEVTVTEYDDEGTLGNRVGEMVSAFLRVPNSTAFSIFGLADDDSWLRYENPEEPWYDLTTNLVWFGNGGQFGPPWTPNQKYNIVAAALQVQELRLRRCKRTSPTTATLSGTRVADAAVNVALSHGTAGNWTYPSSTRWACDVTGLTPGVTCDVTVTSGAQTATGKAVAGVLSVWDPEPLETVPEGVTRLRGSRPYGATVTVSGSGNIGAVSHPEGASGGKYWTVDITGAGGTYTIGDGTSSVVTAVEVVAGPHTLRGEAGGAPATVTLSPGADVVTMAAKGAASAPSLSAAPSLSTMAAKGSAAIGSVSATSALGTMAAAAAMVEPEILSPDTGHRIRAVCGAGVAVANLVPGADLVTSGALGAAGAIALSAEVALGTMAAAGLMSAPGLSLPLPSMALAGALVAPTLSGAPALAAMAARGTMRIPFIDDGVGNSAPWTPYNPCLGTLPRPWWQRVARGRH